jgi:hypothetical protein
VSTALAVHKASRMRSGRSCNREMHKALTGGGIDAG